MLFSSTSLWLVVIFISSCQSRSWYYEDDMNYDNNWNTNLDDFEEYDNLETRDSDSSGIKMEDLFEGDLVISQDIINAFYGLNASTQTLIHLQKWPDNTIFYTFDQSIRPITKRLIKKAISHWERNLDCVQFVEGYSETGYVKFQSLNPHCYTMGVGYQGPTPQIINLEDPRCLRLGTIMHEIGHTLGYWHEQSRPDRDNYIKIIENNVKPRHLKQFLKHSMMSSSGKLEYDYDSIMHYSETAFSRNGRRTIVVANEEVYRRQGSPVIGQRNHLSALDITGMKLFYGCNQQDLHKSTN